MTTIVQRLQKFIHSPQGKKAIDKGQEELAKPENQARLRRGLDRLKGKRR